MLARSVVVASLGALTISAAANAAFTSYVIRNDSGGNPPQILPNNAYVPGATEFVIGAASQKAAWGTNDQNGTTLGNITQLGITRHDNSTRFTAGSGPAVAPYFNIWITDGVNYAVIANEPSNPSFQMFRTNGPNGSFSYNFSIADIANEPAKVFETPGAGAGTSWVHLATGQSPATLKFSHLLNFMIGAPSAAFIAGGNGIGGGAPRELSTNTAYGINWVFGDTLSNYVSGAEGYVVSNPVAVPAPGAAVLAGIGGLVAVRRRRR
jgi:hypothetical protein